MPRRQFAAHTPDCDWFPKDFMAIKSSGTFGELTSVTSDKNRMRRAYEPYSLLLPTGRPLLVSQWRRLSQGTPDQRCYICSQRSIHYALVSRASHSLGQKSAPWNRKFPSVERPNGSVPSKSVILSEDTSSRELLHLLQQQQSGFPTVSEAAKAIAC